MADKPLIIHVNDFEGAMMLLEALENHRQLLFKQKKGSLMNRRTTYERRYRKVSGFIATLRSSIDQKWPEERRKWESQWDGGSNPWADLK